MTLEYSPRRSRSSHLLLVDGVTESVDLIEPVEVTESTKSTDTTNRLNKGVIYYIPPVAPSFYSLEELPEDVPGKGSLLMKIFFVKSMLLNKVLVLATWIIWFI